MQIRSHVKAGSAPEASLLRRASWNRGTRSGRYDERISRKPVLGKARTRFRTRPLAWPK